MIEAIGLIARFVSYCGILGIVGAVAFRLFVVIAALAKLVLQTAEMRFPTDSWIDVGSRMLFETGWGTTWMLQVGCALLITMTFTLARKDALPRWNMLALLSVVLAATPALSSHARSAQRLQQVTVPADALHVLGASLWIGTLFVMFLSIVRGDGIEPGSEVAPAEMRASYIASMLRSFSPLALLGSGVVVASGVVSSLAHITTFNELRNTAYGQKLLIKLIAVWAVWMLGWINWKFNTPKIQSAGARPITRGMALELTLAVLVLLATSTLVVTPPPAEASMMMMH